MTEQYILPNIKPKDKILEQEIIEEEIILTGLLSKLNKFEIAIKTFDLFNEQKEKPTDLPEDVLERIKLLGEEVDTLKKYIERLNMKSIADGELTITNDILETVKRFSGAL